MGCETVICAWCRQAIRHFYCQGWDRISIEACKHCDPGNPDLHERRVKIYRDPFTRKEFEGEAEIVEMVGFEDDGLHSEFYDGERFIFAMVRFDDSLGKYMRKFGKKDLLIRGREPKFCFAGNINCARLYCHGHSDAELKKMKLCPYPDEQIPMKG